MENRKNRRDSKKAVGSLEIPFVKEEKGKDRYGEGVPGGRHEVKGRKQGKDEK